MSDSVNPIFRPETWTTEYLRKLLDDEATEYEQLDFKRAASLPPRKSARAPDRDARIDEMTRDVTAFANSGGGVLLYGAAEGKRNGEKILEKFDPISTAEQSAEDIERLLQGNLGTMLPRFQVKAVPCQDDEEKRRFVVIIVPPSHTAHMAKDGCYYYRHATSVLPMADWQVRDAMNRARTPLLSMRLIWEPNSSVSEYGLKCILHNEGSVGAQHWSVRFDLPSLVCGWAVSYHSQRANSSKAQNAKDGQHHLRRMEFRSKPGEYLFPGSGVIVELTMTKDMPRLDVYTRRCISYEVFNSPSIDSIRVVMYADNMPMRKQQLSCAHFKSIANNELYLTDAAGQICQSLEFQDAN